MKTSIVAAGLSVFGLIMGYMLSLWRTRLRLWVMPLGFDRMWALDDPVAIPGRLIEASRKSLWTSSLTHEVASGDLVDVSSIATSVYLGLQRSKSVLEQGLDDLSKANSTDEKTDAVRLLMNDAPLSDLLEFAAVARRIRMPKQPASSEALLRYFVSEEDGGCFEFYFGDTTVRFGSSFARAPYRQEDLAPVADLIARLDTSELTMLMRQLQDLRDEQEEVNQTLSNEGEGLLEDHSRWSTEVSITNFGAQPALLFRSQAWVDVSGPDIKVFKIASGVAVADDQSAGREVMVLPPTETIQVALVSELAQANLEGGEVIAGAYKQGNASARVGFHVMRRELPGRRRVQSHRIPFRPEDGS